MRSNNKGQGLLLLHRYSPRHKPMSVRCCQFALHSLALLRRMFWFSPFICGSPNCKLCFYLLLWNSKADLTHTSLTSPHTHLTHQNSRPPDSTVLTHQTSHPPHSPVLTLTSLTRPHAHLARQTSRQPSSPVLTPT